MVKKSHVEGVDLSYDPLRGYYNREMRITPPPVLSLSGACGPFPTSVPPNSFCTTAASRLCIQTKRCVIRQSEGNLAASGSEVVAAERV